jgi:hypothetical protein
MTLPRPRWLLVLVPLVGLAALAVQTGQSLYIRAKDTKLLKDDSLTAAPAGLLQPGTEVKWQAVSSRNKLLHHVKVTFGGQEHDGWVLQGNLAPRPPVPEYLKSGEGLAVDPQVFASSGAATKALDEAGTAYAKGLSQPDLAQRFEAAERISRAVDVRRLAQRNAGLGLASVDAAVAKGGRK